MFLLIRYVTYFQCYVALTRTHTQIIYSRTIAPRFTFWQPVECTHKVTINCQHK